MNMTHIIKTIINNHVNNIDLIIIIDMTEKETTMIITKDNIEISIIATMINTTIEGIIGRAITTTDFKDLATLEDHFLIRNGSN